MKEGKEKTPDVRSACVETLPWGMAGHLKCGRSRKAGGCAMSRCQEGGQRPDHRGPRAP